jgi:hypothetical protein
MLFNLHPNARIPLTLIDSFMCNLNVGLNKATWMHLHSGVCIRNRNECYHVLCTLLKKEQN